MNGSKRAIVVGCSVYETDGIPNLRYAEADSAALYERLINTDVGGYAPGATELLKSPGADPLRRALERLLRTAQPDDRILLYFAGHGLRDEAGRMHLALRDTDPDLVRATGISAQLLRELLDECRSKHICLIMDCCFSGAIAGMRGVASLDRDEMQRSVESLGGQGTVILTSAQASQQAREREEYGHGVFTHYLLEGLDGAADGDQDGVITPDELYRYIASRMEQEVGQTQRPTFTGNLVGGTFPLALSKRRRSEAVARLLDDVASLCERRLHVSALNRLDEFLSNSASEKSTLEETRGQVRREMQQLGADFRRRVFDHAREYLLPDVVFREILSALNARPEQIFVDESGDVRQSLLRNYFLERIDPRGIPHYWPTDKKDVSHDGGKTVGAEPASARPSNELPAVPAIPVSEIVEAPRPVMPSRVWTRRVAPILAFGALGVAAWLLLPMLANKVAISPESLRVGLLLKREWTPPERAKQTFRVLLEQVNARIKSEGYQFKADVEAFATVEEVVARLKAGQLDLIGELSPHDIYLAYEQAGALPFVSPTYLNSNVYNGVFVMSSRAPCMQNKETCWEALTQALAQGKGRLAYTDKHSTSGYWVPRGLILDVLETTKSRLAFGEIALPVGADEFIETIACGGRNVLAGVIAEFRLARAAKESVDCADGAASVVSVFRTPTIHNGAYVLRRELAEQRGLIAALQRSWEPAVVASLPSAPIKLEATWTSVELAHYDAEFLKFTRLDPVEMERDRREKLVLIASGLLIVITSLGYLWVSRRRARMIATSAT
jgi:ABC-type phosphate/phosphonate transport system substrate-binding protein